MQEKRYLNGILKQVFNKRNQAQKKILFLYKTIIYAFQNYADYTAFSIKTWYN